VLTEDDGFVNNIRKRRITKHEN